MIEGSIVRPREDSTLRTDSINKFIDDLLVVMDRISDIPIKLLRSGSYYDRTKVTVKRKWYHVRRLENMTFMFTFMYLSVITVWVVFVTYSSMHFMNNAIEMPLESKRGLGGCWSVLPPPPAPVYSINS